MEGQRNEKSKDRKGNVNGMGQRKNIIGGKKSDGEEDRENKRLKEEGKKEEKKMAVK